MTATMRYALGPVDDQLIKYDEVMINWLKNEYNTIPGKAVQMMIATPHRGYAEVETSRIVDQDRLMLPRIALTRMDSAIDRERFNPALIRRLGRSSVTPGYYKLNQGQHPVPVTIMYQVDFWCEFVRDMNIWEQLFVYQFAMGYKYFQINVDSVWGDKKFYVHLDAGLVDNSDLEPQEKSREIRRTATLRADAWLYDQHLLQTPVVKVINLEVSVDEPSPEVKTFSPNNKQTLYVASGGTVFTGASLRFQPVLQNTVVVFSAFGGTQVVAQDDGNGVMFGPHLASGTVDYVTGVVNLTYSTAPDAGNLIASWLTNVEP